MGNKKNKYLLQDYADSVAPDKTLIEKYDFPYDLSAEELLIAKEKREGIFKMLEMVLEILPDDLHDIFFMYCLNGMRAGTIASQYNVHQMVVERKIDSIHKLIKKNQGLYSVLLDMKWCLEKESPTHHITQQGEAIGWLDELYQNMHDKSYWGRSSRRKEFKVKTKCCMDKYTDGYCSLCGIKCTNKENRSKL